MTKTTIYLDVDGVINAISDRPPRANTGWSGDWHQVRVKPSTSWSDFAMTISTELLDQLRELSERPDVTIKWLTTWEHDAPGVLCETIGWACGMDFEVLPRTSSPELDVWWKYVAIRDDWDGESRVIWLDDDLGRYEARAARAWLEELSPNSLGIAPDTLHGLRRADLATIRAFLGAVPEPG